jgi:hypothetical protein
MEDKMSQRIIYKCDRCGATAETTEEKNILKLQNVAVGIQNYSYGSYGTSYHFFSDNLQRQQQWCMKCCEEVGFTRPRKEEQQEAPPKPTLEELIREFLGQIVEEHLPNFNQ